MEEIRKIIFFSDVLGKEMGLAAFLPSGHESMGPLPVLYFLHGRNGDETLIYDSEIASAAEEMISEGDINPMIIVCPRIDNSRGVNSSDIYGEVPDPYGRIINVGRYEDYFIQEVVPLVDSMFNTINERTGRYVGGASAGGYAALHYAFRHGDLFVKSGGHMPAVELKLEDEDKAYFPKMESWRKYDPVSIAGNSSIPTDMKVYLDAGSDDEGRFYEGCAALYKVLRNKGIEVSNHIFPGHHNINYIKSNIRKYLAFYGE
ncbi:MAG: esterase family protein [Bacteroidales bacterium]|nr:esterase family protein [Bacteroidales bacterium]